MWWRVAGWVIVVGLLGWTAQGYVRGLVGATRRLGEIKLDAAEHRLLDALTSQVQADVRSRDPRDPEAVARQTLEMAASAEPYWNTGNAIHYAHLLLGHRALARNDVETAAKELREAGRTPGSPQLNSFGPDMSLAAELLARGERDVVLAYLEDCDRFWDAKRLAVWIADVRAGRTPDWNLVTGR
jgi:hypothetical protein